MGLLWGRGRLGTAKRRHRLLPSRSAWALACWPTRPRMRDDGEEAEAGSVLSASPPKSAKKAPKAKAAARLEPSQVHVKLDDESARGTKRRWVARRDTREQAERVLQDKCRTLDPYTIDVRKVNDLTLREALEKEIRDRREANNKARITQQWVNELIAKYTEGSEGSIKSLTLDTSLVVSSDLTSAMNCFFVGNVARRSEEPLLTYLQHTESLNSREVGGLLKCLEASSMGKGEVRAHRRRHRPSL